MSGLAAPPHAPGERFQCRVDVEDVCLSVEGTAASSTTALFWEEARVACKFNGITQRTRWIALQPAMDEVKKELQTAADLAGADETTAQTGGLLALPYTAFNNLSYEVEFTAAEADDGASASVRTVKPKRFHMMEFAVEAQNLHRVYSASGGQMGDRAPTSGNMEVISASLNKKAAKVSAWTRNIFSKLGGSSGDKKEDGGEKHHHLHHPSAKEQNEAAMAELSEHKMGAPNASGGGAGNTAAVAVGDTTVHEGVYLTVLKNIDVSEAYNRPGGRQTYCLVVKPESRKLPDAGVGTPITISFSIVAHYTETTSVPRNFHNFAIVVDQFVLDYTEAARVLPADQHEEGGQPRPITGYAFGFTANTAAHPNGMEAASRPVPVVDAPAGAGGGGGGNGGQTHNAESGAAAIRVVDFDRLHREGDERKRTPDDYKALPTSCVVVSGSTGTQPANQPRLGNRFVCVSRFKTSPDGLCKPSFKCQFVVSLVRFYGANGGCVREAAAPINLASLLNEEIMPQRIRTVKFELGEVMYLRLRRFSFTEPEVLRSPLLLPYDYNNANVQLPTPPTRQQQQQQRSQRRSNEARAAAAAAAVVAVNSGSSAPATQAAPAASTNNAAANTAPQQEQQQQQQQQQQQPPDGMPVLSFAESDSSSSDTDSSTDAAPAGHAAQHSGSDSDDSTPRVAVQRDPTAPFFTLEPQEDAEAAHNFMFGRPDDAAPHATSTSVAGGGGRGDGGNPYGTSASMAYDPMVAAATAWGGHTAEDETHRTAAPATAPAPTMPSSTMYTTGTSALQHQQTAPAFEMTPTPSNPFFGTGQREDSDVVPASRPSFDSNNNANNNRSAPTAAHHSANPYSFGEPERDEEENDAAGGNGVKPSTTARFELTPFE